MFQVAT